MNEETATEPATKMTLETKLGSLLQEASQNNELIHEKYTQFLKILELLLEYADNSRRIKFTAQELAKIIGTDAEESRQLLYVLCGAGLVGIIDATDAGFLVSVECLYRLLHTRFAGPVDRSPEVPEGVKGHVLCAGCGGTLSEDEAAYSIRYKNILLMLCTTCNGQHRSANVRWLKKRMNLWMGKS